ncbi:MAG TPA: hypothetical protein VM328_12660 [Fimbriimonadaceae bacterium]|jgi:predicted nucleic-acid-binding Zn-ribbon protein|nr:hypothetical protein [Fimbriimonadaceae bacterium]HVM35171.1 hypothetical protein [Actinomycetota bacterium]
MDRTTLDYPWSRISTRNCPTCRLGGGELKVRPPVVVRVGVNEEKLLRVTCHTCGYTMLFDVEVAKARPYPDGSTYERLPDV